MRCMEGITVSWLLLIIGAHVVVLSIIIVFVPTEPDKCAVVVEGAITPVRALHKEAV